MKFKPDYSCRALLTFGGSSLSSCNAKMQTALTLLKDSMSRRLQVVGPGRIHKEQLFWLSLLSTSKSLRILARCARCPKCLFTHVPPKCEAPPENGWILNRAPWVHYICVAHLLVWLQAKFLAKGRHRVFSAAAGMHEASLIPTPARRISMSEA